MGLYTSFNTSDYYGDESKPAPKNTPEKIQEPQEMPKIKEEVRQSLYAQAQEVASSKSKYTGPDFRDVYRVGQAVAIQGPNGNYRTTKGRIAEIVSKNLMYVYMEDTYKDATDQWLVDFVTDTDKITIL